MRLCYLILGPLVLLALAVLVWTVVEYLLKLS